MATSTPATMTTQATRRRLPDWLLQVPLSFLILFFLDHEGIRTTTTPSTSLFVTQVMVDGFVVEPSSSFIVNSRRSITRTTSSTTTWLSSSASNDESPVPPPPPLPVHHVAMKTRNITNAIRFYSLLGFEVHSRFVSGPARCAWLHQSPSSSNNSNNNDNANKGGAMLELVEVPFHVLHPEKIVFEQPKAVNLMERQELLGWNHMALDVTLQIKQMQQQEAVSSSSRLKTSNNSSSMETTTEKEVPPFGLEEWMHQLNTTSLERFGRTVRVALPSRQVILGGSTVYDMAFLYDADGGLIELLSQRKVLSQTMSSGWEDRFASHDELDFSQT